MSFRRARIKAIANLPVRRKSNVSNKDQNSDNSRQENQVVSSTNSSGFIFEVNDVNSGQSVDHSASRQINDDTTNTEQSVINTSHINIDCNKISNVDIVNSFEAINNEQQSYRSSGFTNNSSFETVEQTIKEVNDDQLTDCSTRKYIVNGCSLGNDVASHNVEEVLDIKISSDEKANKIICTITKPIIVNIEKPRQINPIQNSSSESKHNDSEPVAGATNNLPSMFLHNENEANCDAEKLNNNGKIKSVRRRITKPVILNSRRSGRSDLIESNISKIRNSNFENTINSESDLVINEQQHNKYGTNSDIKGINLNYLKPITIELNQNSIVGVQDSDDIETNSLTNNKNASANNRGEANCNIDKEKKNNIPQRITKRSIFKSGRRAQTLTIENTISDTKNTVLENTLDTPTNIIINEEVHNADDIHRNVEKLNEVLNLNDWKMKYTRKKITKPLIISSKLLADADLVQNNTEIKYSSSENIGTIFTNTIINEELNTEDKATSNLGKNDNAQELINKTNKNNITTSKIDVNENETNSDIIKSYGAQKFNNEKAKNVRRRITKPVIFNSMMSSQKDLVQTNAESDVAPETSMNHETNSSTNWVKNDSSHMVTNETNCSIGEKRNQNEFQITKLGIIDNKGLFQKSLVLKDIYSSESKIVDAGNTVNVENNSISNMNINRSSESKIISISNIENNVLLNGEKTIDDCTIIDNTNALNDSTVDVSLVNDKQIENNKVNDFVFAHPSTPLKNRHRIKPAPCLDQKRFASDFENGHSGNGESSQPSTHSITKSNLSRRTTCRTDISRKLANSRKMFYHKFTPDNPPTRSQLTVFDMIYYNPVSNPLRKHNEEDVDDPIHKPTNTHTKSFSAESALTECVSVENTLSERAFTESISSNSTFTESDSRENPSAESMVSNDVSAEDVLTENTSAFQQSDSIGTSDMGVPQIRIGAGGQIVLDEQSLVIETTGTKRGREDMANSHLVYDDGNTNYGLYKKRPRPKDWSAGETLRFYKALSTVGTDFCMMSSIFPGRTRRDLKLKFKKEEKDNLVLVNKVLRNPQNFDLLGLEEELNRDDGDSPLPKRKCKNNLHVTAEMARKKDRKSKLVHVINYDIDKVPDSVDKIQSKGEKLGGKKSISKNSTVIDNQRNSTSDKEKDETFIGEIQRSSEDVSLSSPSTSRSPDSTKHNVNNDSFSRTDLERIRKSASKRGKKRINKIMEESLNADKKSKACDIFDTSLELPVLMSKDDDQLNLTEIDAYIKENNAISDSLTSSDSNGSDISDIVEFNKLNLTIDGSMMAISDLDISNSKEKSSSPNEANEISEHDYCDALCTDGISIISNNVARLPENGTDIITLPFSDVLVDNSQLGIGNLITDIEAIEDINCSTLLTGQFQLNNTVKLVDTPVNNFVVLPMTDITSSENSIRTSGIFNNSVSEDLQLRSDINISHVNENFTNNAIDKSPPSKIPYQDLETISVFSEKNHHDQASSTEMKRNQSELLSGKDSCDWSSIISSCAENNQESTEALPSKISCDKATLMLPLVEKAEKANKLSHDHTSATLSCAGLKQMSMEIVSRKNFSDQTSSTLPFGRKNPQLRELLSRKITRDQEQLTSTTVEMNRESPILHIESKGVTDVLSKEISYGQTLSSLISCTNIKEEGNHSENICDTKNFSEISHVSSNTEIINMTPKLETQEEEALKIKCEMPGSRSATCHLEEVLDKEMKSNSDITMLSKKENITTDTETTNYLNNHDEHKIKEWDFPELHDDSVEFGSVVIKVNSAVTGSSQEYSVFRKSIKDSIPFMERIYLSDDQLQLITDNVDPVDSM